MRISLVATVYNEQDTLDALFASLDQQSRSPDEIVIVDGGSEDGTWGTLQDYARQDARLHVHSRPGCNISEGRNTAIQEASGEIIAVMDAGVRLDPRWLEYLIAPFEDSAPPDVVSGFFVPDAQSTFQVALGAVTLPLLSEIDPTHFYPSSRSVAFRRSAWKKVRGYPEWLDYCEDLVYDFALEDAGFRFVFEPRAIAYFEPRRTLGAFFRQYYRYARGDGKADLWRMRHLIRYATYLVALPLLLALALWHDPMWVIGLMVGLAGLLRTPYRRLWPQLKELERWDRFVAILWAPVIRIVGDLAKMLGYPVGVLWRHRYAPTRAWSKRQM